jgi:hypothetical protein
MSEIALNEIQFVMDFEPYPIYGILANGFPDKIYDRIAFRYPPPSPQFFDFFGHSV